MKTTGLTLMQALNRVELFDLQGFKFQDTGFARTLQNGTISTGWTSKSVETYIMIQSNIADKPEWR